MKELKQIIKLRGGFSALNDPILQQVFILYVRFHVVLNLDLTRTGLITSLHAALRRSFIFWDILLNPSMICQFLISILKL